MPRNTPSKVDAVNLSGFTSAELTALSRRILAARKVVNGAKRETATAAKRAKIAARKARLEAELKRLGN
jgi:hypothetical protein